MKVKRFECKICNKKFKDQSNKNRHMRNIHKSKKRFECHICPTPVSFSRSDNLTLHLKRIHGIHNNKQSANLFSCDLCSATYNLKIGIIKHMKIFHKNYRSKKHFVCQICEQGFIFKDSLVDHLKGKHLKNFCCRHCHKILGSKRTLKRHEERETCKKSS